MKLLLLSDTHLRSTTPVGRTDDFLATQLEKWKFIFETVKEEGIECIIQAGDLFDKPTPPLSLLIEYIQLFQKQEIPIYCVYGQHDMMMRSVSMNKTAIGLFQSIDLVKLVGTYPCAVGHGTSLFGVSFGEDYDKVTTALNALEKTRKEVEKGDYWTNILVVHDAIGDKPLFPGHQLTKAIDFLATWKEFDVILCGDYHYPFFEELDGRVILNTGCLLRMSRVERDMERHPHFYIFDNSKVALSERFRKVLIPIRHWRKVFKMEEKPNVDKRELEEFIELLKQSERIGTSFIGILIGYMERLKKEGKLKKEVEDMINAVMQESGEGND